MYAISGFFNERLASGIPFGGFCFVDKDIQEEVLKSSTNLTGVLTDDYGSANIEGSLTSDSLKFDKIYVGKDTVINYEFSKGENGLWLGEYSYGLSGRGKTVCKAIPCFDNITLQQRRIPSPEEWANSLVDQMVEEGMLTLVDERECSSE